MIRQSDCGLDCDCCFQEWSMLDVVAMEPQDDGSVLVTLEYAPTQDAGWMTRPGVRYQMRLRQGSLRLRAKMALVNQQEVGPRRFSDAEPALVDQQGVRPRCPSGAESAPDRTVHVELRLRGVAARLRPESGVYLTTQILPESLEDLRQ